MILEKDWLFSSDAYTCSLRAAGLLMKNSKILVQRDLHGDEYALPGGHIKIGETLEDGLIREYREEMGADILIKRLLWSEECFWEWNGKQAHTLTFYYLINLYDGARIPDQDEWIAHQDNSNVVSGWLPIDEIGHVTLYPLFLKDEIHSLKDPIKHFITR